MPALVAAEVPIITVEVALAAVFSFTLIAPLGVPWWVPAIAVAVQAGAVVGLRRVSERRRTGLWAGLAVFRKQSRGRMIAFTLLAVCAQVARNWLMLHAIGVEVSIFDAMALLIAMFTLGQLPIGPSIGPAAAVLILGAHGVAATAAAGVLLDGHRHRRLPLLRRVGDHRPDHHGPTQRRFRNHRGTARHDVYFGLNASRVLGETRGSGTWHRRWPSAGDARNRGKGGQPCGRSRRLTVEACRCAPLANLRTATYVGVDSPALCLTRYFCVAESSSQRRRCANSGWSSGRLV